MSSWQPFDTLLLIGYECAHVGASKAAMQAKRETIFMRERAGHNADLTYAQWRTWDEERLELVFAAAALGE